MLEEKLLSLSDVTEFFKISRRTAYYWIQKQILKPVKIAGILRFRNSDIQKLIHETDPVSKPQIKILAIDDDILVRDSLKRLLSQYGYLAKTVASGSEAIALLKSEDFDLIISDFRMPEMNGIETLTRIKKIRRSIPQILLTGYADEQLEIQAKKAGIRQVVSKPFDLAQFNKMIEQTLN